MVPKIRNDLEPHYQLHRVCTKLLREVGKYLTWVFFEEGFAYFGSLRKQILQKALITNTAVTLGRMES